MLVVCVQTMSSGEVALANGFCVCHSIPNG